MFETPVLFIIFNRPDLQRQVLERIREVKPKQLFIVADGPRPDRPDDVEKCQKARNLIDELVDWECELHKNYSDDNMGCRDRVSSGITWFFEHVEEGIILEDDCFTSKEGFDFLAANLIKFRNDVIVGSVTLVNKLDNIISLKKSAYKSVYAGIWGWATWRENWTSFVNEYKEEEVEAFDLSKKFNTNLEQNYNKNIVEKMVSRRHDSWGYGWRFYHFMKNWFCIRPQSNLVQNIGFGEDATHTKNSKPKDFRNDIVVYDLSKRNEDIYYSKFLDYLHVAKKMNMNSIRYKMQLFLFRGINFILHKY